MSSKNEVLRAAELGERIPYRLWLPYIEAPEVLQNKWGKRWNEAVGLFADAEVEAWTQSIRAAWPSTTPNDALDLVGISNSGGIERFPGEADGPLRTRLENRWVSWEESGRRVGIENRLEEYISTTPPNATCWDMAAGWVDVNTWSWDRLWIVIEPPHSFAPLLAADDVYASDELIGVDGLSATQYRIWRRIVHKYRPAHAHPIEFVIVYTGTLPAPSTTDVDTLVAAGDAVRLAITKPQASDDLYADDTVYAGYFIEPL
jgi:hypothetical protein